MASRRGLPAMCRFLLLLLLFAQLIALGAAAGKKSSKKKSNWLTLDGTAPKVVARGGFSGLFPDSSIFAYSMAMLISVPDVVLWCDVQLTKDGAGICFPSLNLNNGSDIQIVYTKQSSYLVNGVKTDGYFTIDYTLNQLANVSLTQGIYSRPPNFDASGFSITTVEDVFKQTNPSGFWLNIQHDAFFSQHKLSMQSFLLGVAKSGMPIDYLSSPEVGFLRGIGPKLKGTKFIFRFLDQDENEPTTNQTYGSLLKNLTFIKTFAVGILVPKSYIWPFDSSMYLLPQTSLVHDAHGAGLQIYAADFANDNVLSYNYSYNPVSEYLNFIDNGVFSVDGVLSDFPITPSEAIDCFAQLGKNASGKATPLIISNNGASGDYPGCTDLAYTQAISDGADIIDCNVQMSKDGIPFCLSSINLIDSTTIAQTGFITLQEQIPELQLKGIFTFKLTWKEIQGLTPAISNPFTDYDLFRNPINKNAGKLVSLADFLGIAKNSTASGVVIRIENAAYLAQKRGMSVTDAVLKAVGNARYDNETAKQVMIQSTNSSVLEVFKGKGYQLAYEVDEIIRDAQNSTIADIQSFADTVVITENSVYPREKGFLLGQTNVVDKLHASKLRVFVRLFTNEFISQAWDFFSDPIVELNSFALGAGVDGVITDYPQTAAAYRNNRCLSMGKNTPGYMLPVQPGSLLQLMNPLSMPPAQSPAPVLSDSDVAEPPLPAVVPVAAPAPSATETASQNKTTSDAHRLGAASASLAVAIASAALLW
ncbi:hypothetical protein V2J09_014026 [Rumex salicifolius]